MLAQANALIIQSGGPTSVINQSLAGIVITCKEYPEINKIYGAHHGLHGLLSENIYDLTNIDVKTILKIGESPGAALGTARIKPHTDDLERLFEVLTAHNIKFLFYNGGNDSAEAAELIREAANSRHYDVRILHIPKTIDNDLMVTDHCPGYGSAARVVAHILVGDDLDNYSFKNRIKINIVMGRHTGWIAAASAIAKKFHTELKTQEEMGPNLIYFPEIEFDERRFLHDVQKVYDRLGRVTIVVAEGLADQLYKNIAKTIREVDEFGNAQISDSGRLGDYLARHIKKHVDIDVNLAALRCRADTLGFMQRSLFGMQSEVDQNNAFLVGSMAVHYMMQGESDKMITLVRVSNNNKIHFETSLCDLKLVAKKTKLLPRTMINKDGNGVTEEFYDYALALVGTLSTVDTIQAPIIQKVLQKYIHPRA